MKKLFKIIIPVVILILAGLVSMVMIQKRPEPRRMETEGADVLVRVMKASSRDMTAVVSSTGTVRVVREADISAQISGRVDYVSPNLLEGKVLDKDEVILRVDDRDYRFAIKNARAEVARAELELARIESSARVARQEWELFDTPDGSQPNPLVLYEPQLENARAALESSRAALDQAELNLERTVIRAPFVSLVRSQNAAPGRHIAPGTPVAVLAEVNRAEIVVHLPLSDLQWIDVPRAGEQDKGSAAAIRIMGDSGDFSRSGIVSRSLGQVDPDTRMLGIVVEVEDPYALFSGEQGRETELPFGSFVQVKITGKELENVMVLPRQALRQDSTVWIADPQNRLEIREVTVKRSQKDQVMISSGLKSGERVVLTSISSPADGMKLRVQENHE